MDRTKSTTHSLFGIRRQFVRKAREGLKTRIVVADAKRQQMTKSDKRESAVCMAWYIATLRYYWSCRSTCSLGCEMGSHVLVVHESRLVVEKALTGLSIFHAYIVACHAERMGDVHRERVEE